MQSVVMIVLPPKVRIQFFHPRLRILFPRVINVRRQTDCAMSNSVVRDISVVLSLPSEVDLDPATALP